jgi:hypothetical protein
MLGAAGCGGVTRGATGWDGATLGVGGCAGAVAFGVTGLPHRPQNCSVGEVIGAPQ